MPKKTEKWQLWRCDPDTGEDELVHEADDRAKLLARLDDYCDSWLVDPDGTKWSLQLVSETSPCQARAASCDSAAAYQLAHLGGQRAAGSLAVEFLATLAKMFEGLENKQSARLLEAVTACIRVFVADIESKIDAVSKERQEMAKSRS
jgi:hypothetical protein